MKKLTFGLLSLVYIGCTIAQRPISIVTPVKISEAQIAFYGDFYEDIKNARHYATDIIDSLNQYGIIDSSRVLLAQKTGSPNDNFGRLRQYHFRTNECVWFDASFEFCYYVNPIYNRSDSLNYSSANFHLIFFPTISKANEAFAILEAKHPKAIDAEDGSLYYHWYKKDNRILIIESLDTPTIFSLSDDALVKTILKKLYSY